MESLWKLTSWLLYLAACLQDLDASEEEATGEAQGDKAARDPQQKLRKQKRGRGSPRDNRQGAPGGERASKGHNKRLREAQEDKAPEAASQPQYKKKRMMHLGADKRNGAPRNGEHGGGLHNGKEKRRFHKKHSRSRGKQHANPKPNKEH